LSDAAVAAKRVRRRLERLWKRTDNATNRLEYRAACRTANLLINESRTNFISSRVNAVSNSCKDKWKQFNNILHTSSSNISRGLGENPAIFCEKLATFFIDKISKLHAINRGFLTGLSLDPFMYDRPAIGPSLDTFTPVTPAEVFKLISSLHIKKSSVDAFPASIIKPCSKSFSIIISNLANNSFAQGRFPLHYKQAQITPILKKPQLNPDDLANYRPISNLNTLSKILERLALARLSPFILSSSNFNPLQSAYRKNHSTETCIIKTLSDVYKSIEAGTSTLAVALDLSAAFDTVCHSTLMSRLENSFGLSGAVLRWISSYIADRSQFILVEGCKSSTHSLTFGVPQGSVLGPLLFTTYTSPTSHLVSSFGLSQQQYADDTIIYLSLAKSNPHCSISTLENCLSSLRLWFTQNSLTINPSKSVSTMFSTAQRLQKLNNTGLKTVSVAGCPIQIDNDSTALGVTLDSTLSLTKHVKHIVSSSNFHLRALRHIRHILSDDNDKTIGAALIHSKLDYANAIVP
jgi:retron-type reverse transcriptase